MLFLCLISLSCVLVFLLSSSLLYQCFIRPWGQIAAASAPTNRHPNKLELKTHTSSMWPTCGSAHVAASLDLWRVKETSLDVKGNPCSALHSHNIPAVLLTGVSGTLRTLFCQRLNKHIRLIVEVCNGDWEGPPSLNPKVNQNSMWMFELSSRRTLMSAYVCVCGLRSMSRVKFKFSRS